MGGKSKAPPAPNYQPLAAAQVQSAQYSNEVAREQLQLAREQMQIGRDQFGVAQEQWRSDQERLDRQEARWDDIINDQLRRQDELDTQAAADRRRYEQVFQPLEDTLVAESRGYTDERNALRGDTAAGRAAADVSNQFAAARTAAQDRLESYGIDPSQVRGQAIDLGARTQEAAARAGQANMTREQVVRAEEATGRALRSEALNIGRGYPGQIATNYGLAFQQGQGAANIGGQAIGAGLNTTASGFNTMGTGAQWSGIGNQTAGIGGQFQGLSNSALAGAANTLNMGYQNVLDRYKANNAASSGWGSALGLIGGIGMKAAFSPVAPFSWLAQEGGAIPEGEPGVHVPEEASPSRGSAIDDVPARVTPGEFIVPKETVQWLGEKHFQKLIQKSREEKAEAQARPRVQAVPLEEPTVVSPGARGTPPPLLPPPGPPLNPQVAARAAMARDPNAMHAQNDILAAEQTQADGPPLLNPALRARRAAAYNSAQYERATGGNYDVEPRLSGGGLVPRRAIDLAA